MAHQHVSDREMTISAAEDRLEIIQTHRKRFTTATQLRSNLTLCFHVE